MKRKVMAGVLMAACCAVGRAQAADDLALPVQGVITNPDWESRPSGEDMSEYYPKLAMALNMGGRAVIACAVAETGAVENCTVASEAPLGLGFGAAAVQLSSLFRMKPRTVDGAPVAGASVRIPLNFNLGDSTPVEAAPDGPAPSARAMTAARRVATAMFSLNTIDKQAQGQLDMIENAVAGTPFSGPEDQAARKRAIEALHESFTGLGALYSDALASVLAKTYSGEDLEQIAAFLETPAGQRWFKGLSDVGPELAKAMARASNQSTRQAALRFCQTVTCPAGSVPGQ